MRQRVLLSSAIEHEKLPFVGSGPLEYGRAHYSWKIVASLYEKGFEAANVDVIPVLRPEIYQSKIAEETFGLRHDDIHLAVKPIEHITPFYRVKNVFVCGWEFPEFSTQSYDSRPSLNQIAILKKADQVWCWSDFTKSNLLRYGVHTAITLPPPVLFEESMIPANVLGLTTLHLDTTKPPGVDDFKSLGTVLKKFPDVKIFFSILNPWDRRKQLALMISAFRQALESQPKILLIIKLVIDNEGTKLQNIQDILTSFHEVLGKCEEIIFIGETLTAEKMRGLVRTADFYLCTSATEGLNLPLIEAMAVGVVPISTTATAMADYINSGNSLILQHENVETSGASHVLSSYLRTTYFPPTKQSTVAAILKASALPTKTFEELSANAKLDVWKKYSVKSFVSGFNDSRGVK